MAILLALLPNLVAILGNLFFIHEMKGPIPKDTIDQIFESARIEEVVGDFVALKKRGVNYI